MKNKVENVKNMEKLKNEFYDKIVDLYGDDYKYITIEIKMFEELSNIDVHTELEEALGRKILIKHDAN